MICDTTLWFGGWTMRVLAGPLIATMGQVTTLVSTSPYSSDDVVAEVEPTSHGALAAAIEAAGAGAREWRAAAATARAQQLHSMANDLSQARDRITDLVVREVDKPVSEARGEVQRGIDILRYHAGSVMMPAGDVLPGATASGWQFTRRRALGTVAVVTPWNFPIAIPLWRLVPALAWGTAVLLKPSSAAIGVAGAVSEILQREQVAAVRPSVEVRHGDQGLDRAVSRSGAKPGQRCVNSGDTALHCCNRVRHGQ